MNFKQLLSYLYPIKEFQTPSEINKNIEVTWNNGSLVLDSLNTNFSFGSLEKVMRIGLKNIGTTKINNFSSVLVLGVAGGSVIKVLQRDYNFTGKITGVEIDAKIIEVANKYFGLQKMKNTEIIEADAQIFIKQTTEKYNCIIIDIFQDKHMPQFLFTEEFIVDVKRILSENGSVLFNSIVTLSNDFERNLVFEKLVRTHFLNVEKLSEIEGNNELFILSK